LYTPVAFWKLHCRKVMTLVNFYPVLFVGRMKPCEGRAMFVLSSIKPQKDADIKAHSFNRYLSSMYMVSIIFDTEDTKEEKKDMVPALKEFVS
jgi:hypothetical protein